MTRSHARSSLAWVHGFVLPSAVWGSSFALIKIALEAGVAPPRVAFARCALGALTLLVICVLTRTPLPRDRATWGHAAVVAVLANTVPFMLLAYGEQHVDSVLAGLLNATTPLMTLLFVPLLVPTERITGCRVAGLLIGFAGVLCVLGVWRGVAGATVTGVLACLGSTASYGATFAYMQRFFAGRSGSTAALSAPSSSARVPSSRSSRPRSPACRTGRAGRPPSRCWHSVRWARGWRMCSTSGSSGPRDRPSPRRSPTSSRCGRRPSAPCCWPNR